MTDTQIVVAILIGTVALFVSDRLRLDVVAVLALLALAFSGVLPLAEALAGFASPAMLMIAGLFVVGAGLSGTGVADWIGRRLERRAGPREASAVALVMGATALLSAFMSSTGTVAILLPVVGTLAKRRGIAPARLLMPLAFGAHLGSNLTLIATPPNILVSDALRAAGREPFRFFSFLVPGLVVLVAGLGYMVTIGRRKLPGRSDAEPTASVKAAQRGLTLSDLASEYGLASSQRVLRVPPGSKLAGLSLGQSNLRARLGVTVVGIAGDGEGLHLGHHARRVVPATVFHEGDELCVLGTDDALRAMQNEYGLIKVDAPGEFGLAPEESLVEVVLPRRSRLAGRALRDSRFRDRYRASVLAVRRSGGAVVQQPLQVRDLILRAGDTLLLKGRRKLLRNLREEQQDLVLVAEPDTDGSVLGDRRGAVTAVAITLAMLLVMAFGLVPNVLAVLAAAAAMVLLGCVRPAEVYRSINWESVVLIACMIPLASALEKTGATGLLVAKIEGPLAGAGPTVVLACLVGVTSALGMVLSNTATALLIAPLAMRLSSTLGLAPEPLLIGVAFASSAAFATPIASPVNVLVTGPGGYKFKDFVRVGLPLQVLVLAVTVIVVPLVWRF